MAPLLAHTPGVDRAFERLYRRHALDVYRYAYGVLRNAADAEDVAQTTFMNAYRALERWETPQSPLNWLIAIAHNVCRQRFRQASRLVQEVGLDVDVADALVGVEDDDTPSPEDIKRALGHLAFNQRSALVMRELEGRSYAEIADLLGLSVSAVETLIFRARRALREQLEDSVTCGQAERLLSRQLDSALDRGERSQLRAHVRACADCRTLARRQRAQRSALKALGAVPLPPSLASLFGGGGAVVATKVAAVVVATGVVGGLGLQAHELLQPAHAVVRHTRHVPAVRPEPSYVQPIAAIAIVRPHEASPATHRLGHVAPALATVAPAPPVAAHTPVVDQAAPRAHAPGTHGGDAGSPPEAAPKPDRSGSGGAPGSNGKHNGQEGTPADDGTHGKAKGKGAPVDLPVATPPVEAPSAPTATVPEAPAPVAPGLTQTSQDAGARNDPVRHLHP